MNELEFLLSAPALEVAPRLLGCVLKRQLDHQTLLGLIVETEAYDQTDAASHSYRGQTARTDVMFGPAGRLYVYFTYGMHYCCNVVCGETGQGSAVLIRALQPLEGEPLMSKNRHGLMGVNLTNGPAKLCQALAIDKTLNGHDLSTSPIELIIKPPLKRTDIIKSTRIGIKRATDKPWRFYLKGNDYVSKV